MNRLNWQIRAIALSIWQDRFSKWQAMDVLDERLVTLLRHDGRRSISDLAVDLGVSRATVRARLERLERQGDILGYTVILRADALEQRVRGITMIEVEGHAADRVVRALGGFPEISAIHTTNGRWDLVVELNTDTLTQFDAVLRKMRLIQGITGSETTLLLATPRSTRARL
jgi:DNA-binding Lrp family transcriptional regulator